MNSWLRLLSVSALFGAVSCSHGTRVSFPAAGADACATGSHPLLSDRKAQVMALRDTIERSLAQTTPNFTYPDGSGAGRVFNGNFDWHSSVHAHWALLSIARTTGDSLLAAQVMSRLTPAALAAEDRRLKSEPEDPPKEMPYGQSWLLLLLQELRLHPTGSGNTPEAAELRRATEERVVSFLEQASFPEGRKNGSDPAYFSRAHTSWLFSYWLLKLSGPSPRLSERVARLSARLEAQRATILKQTKNEPRDFLYLPALLWLVDHTSPNHRTDWRYADEPVAFPELPVVQHNAHQSGAVAVSLWPYALQSARGERASCERFNRLLDELGAHPEYWRYDPSEITSFSSVGHWVPQFIWMGMLLESKYPLEY
jgi:hypothetical protein